MHTALQAVPAEYRDRVTITATGDATGALHIAFADVLNTAEQRATITGTESGTRAHIRAQQKVADDVAKEVRTTRAKVASALRAAGYDVTDAGGGHARVIGDLEGSTVRPLAAVSVAFGESVSDTGKAWESGVNRGWSHANFVNAYGKKHDQRRPEVPGYHQGHAEAFEQGWREGRKRYARGLWQDGSKKRGLAAPC
ncbi:hypothetical protein ACIQC7_33015 [Kitasatospora sp. NPDC088556]|uniref:hypothetical protein n=1 Tax=Kitasatospora sp. NPDC088556 TaxID=3364076 RepID=UPI003804103D